MCRKWKKTAALGLAVLIGGMTPMSTMLAAEDNTEVAQEMEAGSVSDADEVCDDEVISDENGSVEDEENAGDEVNTGEENAGDEEANAEDDNVGGEENAEDENAADEINAEDVIADEETDTVHEQNAGIQIMAEPEASEASGEEASENAAAPVISITWQGQSYIYDMGGTIEYKYVKDSDQAFECSASQNGKAVSFSYYLDEVSDITAGPKNAEMITWPDGQTTPWIRKLSKNANYVLYVKAVGTDGQTVYARSGGIVVDTIAPKIVGVEAGKTYPAGTTFTVTDANLSEVLINEQKAEPVEGGKYKVATQENSTSCVIRVKDKADNETVCSITVSGGEPTEEPTENTVISKGGVYALKAGVKYHLANGKWKIDGDKTVYQGNSDFYVKEDGDYKFKK